MSEFKTVFADQKGRDDFYLFLKNVFHLYPEDKFHALIQEACGKFDDDKSIYEYILHELGHIKPFLSELTYALPALKQQKAEMSRETEQLLPAGKRFNGYVEIGSTGRYVSELRHHVDIHEPVYLINDVAPSYSPPDIVERAQIPKLGEFIPLNDYAPIPATISDSSIELLTCYIGLHHVKPDALDGFLDSIARVVRPGGTFVLRDHDVKTPEMATFVSLVHTVFNVGLKVSWEVDAADSKRFRTADEWASLVVSKGFTDGGQRLLQEGDPSLNTLMAFTRV